MDNLERWEVLRLSTYNILLIGIILFLIGTIFGTASFGIGELHYPILGLMKDVFQDVGTLCTAVGGVLAMWTKSS